MKNFGKIKNGIDNLLTNSILKEGSDKTVDLKEQLKTIKNNNILKREYIIYSNIEEAYTPDRAEAFDLIKENINLLEDYHPQSIINENIKLTKKLNDKLGSDIGKHIEYDNENKDVKNLHENISKLLHLKKNPTNLNERTKLIAKIADYVQNNKKDELNESTNSSEDVPNDLFINFAIDKFNRKYNNLSETEKRIVKTVINEDKEGKREVFEETRKECINEVNKYLEDASDSIESKHKLLTVKEKLLEMEYDEKTFADDINRMLSFKK